MAEKLNINCFFFNLRDYFAGQCAQIGKPDFCINESREN